MKEFLDRFILGIPILFIKQYPYAWIAAVTLWKEPPFLFPGIFISIVVIGMLLLRWQSAAWISDMRRQFAPNDGKFHIDQPPVPYQKAARNIEFLVAGAALTAFLLKGQFGLNFWQIFIIITGFTIFYRDTQFFGAATTYIITATGIGIHFIPGHLDYRVFFMFKEISRIEKGQFQKDKGWDYFARTRDGKDGLLLIPKDPKGLTKRIERLFIVPKDIEKFLEQLPHGYRTSP